MNRYKQAQMREVVFATLTADSSIVREDEKPELYPEIGCSHYPILQ